MAINIDTNQKEYTYTLTPFMRCVLQNFPFIEEDFDALTNYGLLCKVVEYLNKVIANQNTVQDNVTELNTAFTELKEYVDNYFESQDWQTKVDNKLDEMAEDGTLEELISKYIEEDVARTFINVKMMKMEDLQDTMKVRTLGYYDVNDGGGADYYITETKPTSGYYETLNNGKYALLVLNGTEVNAEVFGFKSDASFNCSTIYSNLLTFTMEDNIYLTFQSKNYYWSETLIYQNNNFNIKGYSTIISSSSNNKVTTFRPYQANQRYIIKIGGNSDFSEPSGEILSLLTSYFSIENIVFSDSNNHLATNSTDTYGCLCMEYATSITLNIAFTQVYSKCMYIKNCWECKIPFLSMRGINIDVNSNAIFIDKPRQDNYSDNTSFIFDDIDIEQINCTAFKFASGCNVQNFLIDDIMIENSQRNSTGGLGTNVGLITDVDTFKDCTPIPLFDVEGDVNGLTINSINLSNTGNRYFYLDTSETKGVDTLFNFGDTYFNISVGKINYALSGCFVKISGTTTRNTAFDSMLNISNLQYNSNTVPQRSSWNTESDKLGYIFIDLPYGIVNITNTNLRYYNDYHVLLPKLYYGIDLLKLSDNFKGTTFSYGLVGLAIEGKPAYNKILDKLYLNYPCKIQIGLNYSAVTSETNSIVIASGSVATGTNCPSSNININTTVVLTVTQDMIDSSETKIWRLRNDGGCTFNHIDYINVIPTF